MENASENKAELDQFYERFKKLLTNSQLTETEKLTLSNEILKVIYESIEAEV
jgi:hypothetical protein